MLGPAPGRVEAPVHEHQRRAALPRRRPGLRDVLEVEAARQAVEAAGLALLERVGARGAEEGLRRPPPHPRRPRRRRGQEERRSGEGGGGHGWPLEMGMDAKASVTSVDIPVSLAKSAGGEDRRKGGEARVAVAMDGRWRWGWMRKRS